MTNALTPSLGPADSRRAKLLALCGLAGALVFGLLPIAHWIAPGTSMPAMLAREGVWWCFALAVLVWLRFVERLPLSSIGFRRPTWKSVAFGVLAAVLLTAVFILQSAVIVPIFHLHQDVAAAVREKILHDPLWYRVLLVLRAAVVEEILFRGYLIEKVRQLSGSTVLAVAVSVAAFTYAHLSGWGIVHLIPVAAGGIIFALLYVWRKDLPSNMLGHFLVDAIGFLGR